MSSPYFDTYLDVDIRLEPRQMNNNIEDNIKENLYKRYNNKCFKNYGYIDAIYNVSSIKGGIIKAEDGTSSSLHRVRFKCRLCNPLKSNNIVAKVTGINNMMIIAETGPIRFLIGNNTINKNNITYLRNKSAFFPITPTGDILDKPIEDGTYVIVKVMNKKIVDRNDKILSVASLESVATNNEIEKAIKSQYENILEIDADTYIKRDEQNEEISDTESLSTIGSENMADS